MTKNSTQPKPKTQAKQSQKHKVCKKKSKITKLRIFLSIIFILSIALNIQNYLEKENIMKMIDYATINNYNMEFMQDVCKRVNENHKQKKKLHILNK